MNCAHRSHCLKTLQSNEAKLVKSKVQYKNQLGLATDYLKKWVYPLTNGGHML